MKKYCQNCYHPLPYKARFCAHCGQKASDGKVPVSDVLQQLWFRILHLESRSWRVLWRLFIPGQVSIDYFSGKRKRYPPPVQFFFVIMFFFLFTLNHMIGNGGFRVRKTADGLNIGYSSDKNQAMDLYQFGRQYWQMRQIRKTIDSLPPEQRTPQIRATLDTVLQRNKEINTVDFEKIFEQPVDSVSKVSLDTLTFGGLFRDVKIAAKDFFLLEPDQIISNYKFTHWYDKLLVRQGVKSMKDPGALVRAMLGSLTWTLLGVVTLSAGALTLLYWRRRRYYVEHFIFLLHEHTSVFLLLTIAFLVHQIHKLPLNCWLLLSAWLVLASLVSMRRYYGQGWLKTLLKWTFFFIAYFASFAALFIIGLLVVFLIF